MVLKINMKVSRTFLVTCGRSRTVFPNGDHHQTLEKKAYCYYGKVMGLPGWVALLFSLFSNALTTYIHTIKFHIPGQSLDRPMSAKNTAQDSTLPIFCFFALDNRPPIFYPFFVIKN